MAEKPTTTGVPEPASNAALVSKAVRGEADGPAIVVEDVVDHQSLASFPASDPPGWWAGR